MSIFRDIGQTVDRILKPDGSQINIGSLIPGIPQGVAKSITGLISENSAIINPDLANKTIGDSSKTPSVKTFGNVRPPPGGPPYENVLEQFASYVPLWTLAALEPNQFNNPSTYRGKPGALKNIVFSSAGRFDAERAKTAYGQPEYFVDNFELVSVISATEGNGNTNVTGFAFDIFEPYSLGLFLQSLQNAALAAGYPTYLGDTPYLLKLEFLGFKDDGSIFSAAETLAKYFTIKINKAEFKVDEGGSKYRVQASPLHHTGFSNVINRVPKETAISGENVKELLVSGQRSLCTALNAIQLDLVAKRQQEFPDIYEIVFPVTSDDPVGLNDQGSDIEILKATADPNAEVKLPLSGRKGQDSQDFGDGEIGAASMGFSSVSGGNYLFKLESDVIDPTTGRINRDQMSIDPKQRTFTFPQGDKVTEIIQRVVVASEYGVKAIKPENMDEFGKVKWFRLDCQVQLLEFDRIRNQRAKKFVFRVVPFKVHGSIFKNPTAQPKGMNALDKVIAKRYDYLYTGQNNDLIKFELSFDGMFATGVMPTPPAQHSSVANKDVQSTANEERPIAEVESGDAATGVTANTGSPRVLPDSNISTSTASGDKTVEQIVADVFQKAFLNSSKDLVNVNIDILGDPYFLSDSGISANYLASGGPTDQINSDGSMNWEGSEIFCYITFRNPVEPNLGTTGQGGLYNFPDGGSVSPFSGIYKVTKITNKFSSGTFQQNLELVRMQGQPIDGYVGGDTIARNNQFMYDTSKSEPPKTSPLDDPGYNQVDEQGRPIGPY
jgi:hypothetical protein